MVSRPLFVLAIGLAAAAATSPAAAFRSGGGSQTGDSYLNDAQRNPRFIEPGSQYDPSRYRASHPREGYDDRQAADAYRRGYRGQVYVRPYGY